MEITLTEKQFEKLLRLTYLGMWVAEVHDQENNNYFSEIEQLVYSHANQIPNQKLIELDEISNKYFPAINFDPEDIIVKYIETYEENIFWDELIDRLTKRDMIKKYGLDGIQKLSPEEVLDREKEFISEYEGEFQKNGIEKIGLV